MILEKQQLLLAKMPTEILSLNNTNSQHWIIIGKRKIPGVGRVFETVKWRRSNRGRYVLMPVNGEVVVVGCSEKKKTT